MRAKLAVVTMLAGAVVFAVTVYARQSTNPITNSSPQSRTDTYTWHGELVSYDDSTQTVTVKARLVDSSAAKDVKAGARMLVQWSGYDMYADAIRQVLSYDAARAAKEPFLMPAEVVSPAGQDQYLTFRFRAPEGTATALKSLKAGQWVTVTSRHRPSTEADAVVGIRSYVASSATSAT